MKNTVKIISKSGRKGECSLRSLPLWEAAGWTKVDAKRAPKPAQAPKAKTSGEPPAIATP